MPGLSQLRSILLPALLLPLVSACSGTLNGYTDSLKYVLFPAPDAQLSNADLAKRPYDSLYAKVGSLPQAVLVLAFIEDGQQKWLSADKAMLVTKQGRLVKMAGFNQNLEFSKNFGTDPLSMGLRQIAVGQQFENLSDWTETTRKGYQRKFEIKHISQVNLTLLGREFQTTLVEEEVTFADQSTFVNQFWFESRTGVLLKSRQQSAHFADVIELTHISTAFRFIPQGDRSEK